MGPGLRGGGGVAVASPPSPDLLLLTSQNLSNRLRPLPKGIEVQMSIDPLSDYRGRMPQQLRHRVEVNTVAHCPASEGPSQVVNSDIHKTHLYPES